MKKERIEELLVSTAQKCGHCKFWRYVHCDMGDCERYQIPRTHKDDGSLCNGFKIEVHTVQIGINEFTEAINQAEKELKLEWYKKLEKKLDNIADGTKNYVVDNVCNYLNEIQEKIKELEK